MNYIHHYQSPLGKITMASDGKSLIGLWFEEQKYFASTINNETTETTLPIFKQTTKWLNTYFSGIQPDFTPKIKINTTSFRKKVYKILLSIPFGQTMTYGQIASIIAEQRGIKKTSSQAIGGAVSHNPISLIIPCHRVVGTNNNLTGYSGGIHRKIKLLELEMLNKHKKT